MKIKQKILLGICMALMAPNLFAQEIPKDERMQWWREARFGMFIHWGVYSQWGGVYKGHEQARGGAEWIMNRCKIPVAEYQERARGFNPVNYNADEWVRTARDAGMKYIVITAKHHDGFAMFKSEASPFNIADWTTYGKDVLKPLADACRKYGIKLGFYYSQAQDWNNPGGTVARKKMKEGWPNPDSTRIDTYTKAHKGHWDPRQEEATFEQYIDRVAIPQVRELLTNYGDIAVLWWDTPVGMTDETALKLQELLKLQPQIITNDRLKRPNFPGDTGTPEQKIPGAEELDGRDWETCMTMNHTWGYRTSDTDWKSAETLIRNLVDIASKGGNYLLNIGPKPDGTFPVASVERLKTIGKWMDTNGEAVYATKASPLPAVDWGRYTVKENQGETVIYATVFDWPDTGKLEIPGLKNPVGSASLLADGEPLKTKNGENGLIVEIPRQAPDAIASVIEVRVKGKVENVNRGGKKKMKTGSVD
ncbi:alpha-L-fucosidase [Sinomicrobium weinanense]|uniref:alpha-L-fucosidase n=1 Tax=Sinomicrobium weinanense TaxID=2842200 RepID=A0A926JVM4_9FLAO|nr:alpha-L-fucosidase [Sinomicrobium weinanense]MBC9798199.1 alpha-L-fucosidase [Sinomicrobium weinanense]MBU3123307.1 alpha-L-fucosidase [Sinomicrobium weinanense]